MDDNITAAGLGCIAYPDGMAVEIDNDTVYEPDALVRCGEPLDDAVITDPLIVVEVLSPSSQARDAGVKLADYARLPSLRHYLLVDIKPGRAFTIGLRRGEHRNAHRSRGIARP